MSRPPQPQSTRRGGRLVPVLCALLAVALVFAAVWAVPAALAERPFGNGEQPMVLPSGTSTDPGELPGVLATATSAEGETAPASGNVQEILDAHLADRAGAVSALVLDARTGRELGKLASSEPRVPASNQKVLTALAVAREVDAYRRLATTVVAGEQPGHVTLVAGGDTLLTPGTGDPHAVNGRAGVQDLADRTADSLRGQKVSGRVEVDLDTSLFTGPAINPAWAPEDIAAGEIAPVAPLAFFSHRVPDEGRDPGERGARPRDAAADVARVFRERLQDRLGGNVRVIEGRRAAATEGARELARVESAPVHEQAAYMLEHSDNSLAETLARVAAHGAGEPADVGGVQRTIRAALTAQGIPDSGTTVVDASGMTLENRVTAETLVHSVRALMTDPAFGPYAQGLPLGGATGTLENRFDDPDEQAARGLTRAKTGTLNSVVSLSGHVQRADGTVLVYSLVCNDVTGGPGPTKDAVDRTVAALARG